MKHPMVYVGVFCKVMVTLLGSFYFLEMLRSGSAVFATIMALGIVGVSIYNDILETEQEAEDTSPGIVCPTCNGLGNAPDALCNWCYGAQELAQDVYDGYIESLR